MNNRIADNLICTAPNEEIVRAFSLHGVEFIVVGGLAMAWYCPSRQADDMDLLANPTAENAIKVARALSALQGMPIVGLDDKMFARAGAHAILKRYYYADILTSREGDLGFAELMRDSAPGKLFGYDIRLPSLPHLIQLKETAATGQESDAAKHRADLMLLREALRREAHE